MLQPSSFCKLRSLHITLHSVEILVFIQNRAILRQCCGSLIGCVYNYFNNYVKRQYILPVLVLPRSLIGYIHLLGPEALKSPFLDYPAELKEMGQLPISLKVDIWFTNIW